MRLMAFEGIKHGILLVDCWLIENKEGWIATATQPVSGDILAS
jgi:hypothetical protein